MIIKKLLMVSDGNSASAEVNTSILIMMIGAVAEWWNFSNENNYLNCNNTKNICEKCPETELKTPQYINIFQPNL